MNKIEKYRDYLIQWLRDWFENNGKDCNAIIGISGGKDSTCVSALCVAALGADRVIGVLMPTVNRTTSRTVTQFADTLAFVPLKSTLAVLIRICLANSVIRTFGQVIKRRLTLLRDFVCPHCTLYHKV